MVSFASALLLLLVIASSWSVRAHSHERHGHGHHHHHDDDKCGGSDQQCSVTKESTHSHAHVATIHLPDRVISILSSYDRYTLTYTSAFLTSTVSLIGVFLLPFTKLKTLPSSLTSLLLAFSSGALISDVFLHLLPHSYAYSSHVTVSNLVLLGALVFSIFSRLLTLTNSLSRTDSNPKSNDEKHEHHPQHHYHPRRPVAMSAYLNLAADALHNFNDGAAVASAFSASIPAGLATTLAVMLHELPQELADYALLLRGGFSPLHALLANFLSATAALAGAGLTLHMGEVFGAKAEAGVMPFAAGGLLYLAIAGVLREVEEMDEKRSASKCVLSMARDVIAAGAGAAVVACIESGVPH